MNLLKRLSMNEHICDEADQTVSGYGKMDSSFEWKQIHATRSVNSQDEENKRCRRCVGIRMLQMPNCRSHQSLREITLTLDCQTEPLTPAYYNWHHVVTMAEVSYMEFKPVDSRKYIVELSQTIVMNTLIFLSC